MISKAIPPNPSELSANQTLEQITPSEVRIGKRVAAKLVDGYVRGAEALSTHCWNTEKRELTILNHANDEENEVLRTLRDTVPCTVVPQLPCTVWGFSARQRWSAIVSRIETEGADLDTTLPKLLCGIRSTRKIMCVENIKYRFQCVSMTASDSYQVTQWIESQTTKRRGFPAYLVSLYSTEGLATYICARIDGLNL
ncbi:hypothetical protein GJ496_000987 [Pomphorhynchus laevis]|nr:hypothetical protein GJ496_000987 [Pomphorhynchus laevis]